MCWGHDTGVAEARVRDFTGNWTGTGTITGTGDAERLELNVNEYMISETVHAGTERVSILTNVYAAGDTVQVQYREGATQAACESASFGDYTVPFVSLGYVQIRVAVPS